MANPVKPAIVEQSGRAKSKKTTMTREIPSVCYEVLQTELYSVKLEGHENLFKQGFQISKASTFFSRPPHLQHESTIADLISNFGASDLTTFVQDLASKVSALTILLGIYSTNMVDEKDVSIFYEHFLPVFLEVPFVCQRELLFKDTKPSCPQGSVDGIIGKPKNGNRPVVYVKDNDTFQMMYLVAINEAKLNQRLSGFLEGSRTQPNEDLKTVYQPIVQTCSLAELSRYADDKIPIICLYGDRQTVRPFLYFREFDVLLTTTKPFTFHNNNQVHLHGLAIISLLFRLHMHPFKESELKKIRNCGWLEAKMKNEPTAYANAWLCIEEDGVEQHKKNPNVGPPPIFLPK